MSGGGGDGGGGGVPDEVVVDCSKLKFDGHLTIPVCWWRAC